MACCSATSLMEWVLEIVALFDWYFDILITIRLLTTTHTGLAAGTVFSMIAPLYASSIQMIEFLREKVIRRDPKKNNVLLLAFAWISILPLFLVLTLLMDIVFVINGAVLEPLIYILGCGRGGQGITSCLESVYEQVFNMKRHEISAFRRMRTITQLLYETLI